MEKGVSGKMEKIIEFCINSGCSLQFNSPEILIPKYPLKQGRNSLFAIQVREINLRNSIKVINLMLFDQIF
jgi:hypothetical protein